MACKHVTGSQRITYHGNEKRVLIGNEVELGIEIPTIKPRISRISRDKGIEFHAYKVHTITKVIVEYVGVSTDLQVPLLIIDRREVSIMYTLFANHRVTNLRDTDTIWSK